MEVKDRLERHLETLFAQVPPSRAAFELKEELLTNSLERYDDLRTRGLSEDEAFSAAVGNIGNVNELLAALPKEDEPFVFAMEEERRSRNALIVTVSVGLYILAAAVLFVGLFLSTIFWQSILYIALGLTAVLCIVPTCLLVYNAYRWPTPKQQNSQGYEVNPQPKDQKRMKAVRGSISSLLWPVTVILYMLISFSTGAWYITWVIFLISACIESVINLLFRLGGSR